MLDISSTPIGWLGNSSDLAVLAVGVVDGSDFEAKFHSRSLYFYLKKHFRTDLLPNDFLLKSEFIEMTTF